MELTAELSATSSLHISVYKKAETSTIRLNGNFAFHNHKNFRVVYTQLLHDPLVKTVEVDFGEVKFVDSSALGMLLILRERMLSFGKQLILKHPSKIASKAFEIANFHQIFTIQ